MTGILFGVLLATAGQTAQAAEAVEIRCASACTVMVVDAVEPGEVYVIHREAGAEAWQRVRDAARLRFEGSEEGDVLIVDTSAPVAVEAHGRGGDDYLSGSSISDVLRGGAGNDTIEGGEASDLCSAERVLSCERQPEGEDAT